MKGAFALYGILFFIGGMILVQKNDFLLAAILILAFILNVSRLFKVKDRRELENINYSIVVMNIIVCISMGIDRLDSSIQYLWYLGAILSIVVLVTDLMSRRGKLI